MDMQVTGIGHEVIRHLPEGDENRIDVAFKIITETYRSRVVSLENEVRTLRHTIEEGKTQFQQLQQAYNQKDMDLIDAHQKLQRAITEGKECYQNNQILKRQVENFERLKQSVLGSFDSHQHESLKESSDTVFSSNVGGLFATVPSPRGISNHPVANAIPFTSHSPRIHPPGTSSSNGFAALGTGPYEMPMANSSPMLNVSNSQEHSGENSFASSAGGNAPFDGKKFFSAAKKKLNDTQFHQLLTLVKNLNNGSQSRSDALIAGKTMFPGGDKDEMYVAFCTLVTRHGGSASTRAA